MDQGLLANAKTDIRDGIVRTVSALKTYTDVTEHKKFDMNMFIILWRFAAIAVKITMKFHALHVKQ